MQASADIKNKKRGNQINNHPEKIRNQKNVFNFYDNLTCAIIVYNTDHNVIYLNAEFERLTGYKYSDTVNTDFYSLLHSPVHKKISITKRLITKTLQTGTGKSGKTNLVIKTGQSHKIQYNVSPISDTNKIKGVVFSFIIINEDTNGITDSNALIKKNYLFSFESDSEFRITKTDHKFSSFFSTRDKSVVIENWLMLLIGKETILDIQKKVNLLVKNKNENLLKFNALIFDRNKSINTVSFEISKLSTEDTPVYLLIEVTRTDYNEDFRQIIKFYENIFSSVSDFIAIVDHEYRYIMVNPNYQNLFNLPFSKIIGRKVGSLIGTENFNKYFNNIYKNCFEGTPQYYQGWLNLPGNVKKYFEINYYPIKTNSSINFIIIVAKDLTDIKLFHSALIESEKRYRDILDNSPLPIGIHQEGKLVYANRYACKLLEYEEFSELEGISILEIIHPDYQEIAISRVKDLFLNKVESNIPLDEKFVTRTGKVIDVEVFSKRIDYNKNFAVLTIVNDITSRKLAEETLRKTNDFHLSQLEDFPALIWRADANFSMNYFNKTWYKFTGSNFISEAKNGWLKNVHPDDQPLLLTQLKPGAFTSSIEFIFRLKKLTGEYRWMDCFAKPFYNIDNNFEGYLGVCFDITTRIQLEDDLNTTKEKYKSFFDDDLSACIVTTPDGDVLECNNEFLRMFGFSNITELRLFGITNLYLDKIHRKDLLTKIIRDKKIYWNEIILKKKDGTHFYVTQNIMGIFNKSGKLQEIRTYLLDITSKKEMENILIENNLFLRESQKIGNIGSYKLDIRKNNWTATETLNDIFGIDNNYVHDLNGWLDIVHPEYRTEMQEYFQNEVIAKQKPFDKCYKILRKNDNDVRWVEGKGQLVLDSGGSPIYLIGTIQDLTERKYFEALVLESEKRYRDLIKNLPVSIKVVQDGYCVFCNPAAEKLHGFSEHEMMGLKLDSIVVTEDRDILEKRILNIEKGISNEITEMRIITKSGDISYTETMSVPISYKGKTSALIISQDITQKKLAENLVREKSDEINTFFQTNLDLLCILDKNGTFKQLNPEWTNTLGYESEELTDKNIIDFLHEDDKEKIIKIFNSFSDQGISNFIVRLRCSDNTYKYTEWRIKLKNNLLFCSARNITERVEAELLLNNINVQLEKQVRERTLSLDNLNKKLSTQIRQMRKVEEQLNNQIMFLRILLDAIPNPIFILNRQKALLECNSMFEELIGKDKQMMTGNILENFPDPVSAQYLDEIANEVIKKSCSNKREFVVDYLGDRRNVVIIVQTLHKSDFSITGLVGIVIDITDQKKMQKEIADSLNREKELSELKSRFISTASHEFRTPLTSILASADLLEMFGKDWEDIKFYEHIAKIQKAVHHMTVLLDDVLTVSRAESGKLQYSPETIHLDSICSEIIDNINMAYNQSTSIVFNNSSNVEKVMLDRKLITHILQNLLSNAIKYSLAQFPVKFDVSNTNGTLIFEVADSGIGIPEKDKAKLFEPFHRATNIGNISGTGLGLSIVKKSVEMHNGSITFESQENIGTRFIIKIPLKKAENE